MDHGPLNRMDESLDRVRRALQVQRRWLFFFWLTLMILLVGLWMRP
jgi:hypothetical protein